MLQKQIETEFRRTHLSVSIATYSVSTSPCVEPCLVQEIFFQKICFTRIEWPNPFTVLFAVPLCNTANNLLNHYLPITILYITFIGELGFIEGLV